MTNHFPKILPPKFVRELLERLYGKSVDKWTLIHMIKTTIGETKMTAGGPGTTRGFSFEDVALLVVGLDLLRLGLPPVSVQQCVSEARREARAVLDKPVEHRLEPGALGDETKYQYLVAESIPEAGLIRGGLNAQEAGFIVRVVDKSAIDQILLNQVGVPTVCYNLSLSIGFALGRCYLLLGERPDLLQIRRASWKSAATSLENN